MILSNHPHCCQRAISLLRLIACSLALLVATLPVKAQDEEDGPGLAPAGPAVAEPDEGDNNFGAGGGRVNGGGPEGGDPDFAAPPESPPIEVTIAELGAAGFAVNDAAFAVFPEAVKGDIRNLVTDLLPLLEVGREKELQTFFVDEGERIATVFDQLDIKPNADGLLAAGDADTNQSKLSFPSEFTDYESYLETLDHLDPFERSYMVDSRNVAEAYRLQIAEAQGSADGIRQALDSYQQQLEAINERFAEQFRDKFLENLDRADVDGNRPDIDR